jgi:hypothetical protein
MQKVFDLVSKYRYGMITAAALILFVYMGLSYYLGAGRDDTFITLWAGENLALGKGLVNHNFERVEISSSLLHTLIIWALAKMAPGYVYTLNKVAGLLAGCLIFWLFSRHRGILFPESETRFPVFCLALSILSTLPSFIYWTMGGLETPFVTLLLFLNALYFLRFWKRPSPGNEIGLITVQCFFLLVRPETFYILPFTLIFVAFIIWLKGQSRSLWRIVLVPALFFLALGLTRLSIFGAFFPNPVYAKTNDPFSNLDHGLNYLVEFYTSSYVFLALGIAVLALVPYYGILILLSFKDGNRLKTRDQGGLVFILGILITVHLVVVAAGGDWMEFYRFMHPVIPLLVMPPLVFLGRLFGKTEEWLKGRRAHPAIPQARAFLICALMAACGWMNLDQESLVTSWQGPVQLHLTSSARPYSLGELFNSKAPFDERVKMLNLAYARDRRLLFPFLDREMVRLHRQAGGLVIATPQMGVFPYYLKKKFPDLDMYFIDTYGLCDPKVASLGLPAGSCGVALGNQMTKILDGSAGPLSTYVLSLNPNMLYRLYEKTETIAELEALGYKAILKRPGAYLYFNPQVRPEKEKAGD